MPPLVAALGRRRPRVDVSTGNVVLDETDLELPGLLPLVLRRTHVSSWQHGQWFGARWASLLEERLAPSEHGLTLLRADGVTLDYRYPRQDESTSPLRGEAWPLRRTAVGGYVLIDPGTGIERHFFGAVRGGVPLAAMRNRNGHRISVVRNGDGGPLEVRHTDGRRVLVETDEGRVRSLRVVQDRSLRWDGSTPGDEAPGGEVVRFDLADGGLLGAVCRTTTGSTRYSYDAHDRLRSWEDPKGNRLQFEYDARGRCITQRGADGVLDRDFAYHAASDHEDCSITVVTDSLGHRRTYRVNVLGQVVHEDDALHRSVILERDVHDRLLSRTDALGRRTEFVRDELGRVIRLVRPGGSAQTQQFHEDTELPERVVDPDGGVWQHEYDDRGNRVRTTDPCGARTTWVYDAGGALLATERADGAVVRHESGADQAAGSVEAGPIRTYGPFGVVATETTPEGAVTRFAHDRELRVIRISYPDGQAETFTRDAAGRVREHVDVEGRRFEFEHDSADQVVRRTDPSGEVTDLIHDVLGRVTRATNEHADVALVRDAMGRVLSESVDGRAVTSAYDEMGRRASRTTPSGSVATWTHDRDGRVVALVVDGHEIGFERDLLGREKRRHLADAAVLDHVRDSGGQPVGQRLTKVGPAPRAVTAGSLADRLGGGAASTAPAPPPSGPRLLLQRTYDPPEEVGAGVKKRRPTTTDHPDRRLDPLGRPLAEDVLVWDGDSLAERVTGPITTTWTCVDRKPVTRATITEPTGVREFCSLVTDPSGDVIAVVAASGDLLWQEGDAPEPPGTEFETTDMGGSGGSDFLDDTEKLTDPFTGNGFTKVATDPTVSDRRVRTHTGRGGTTLGPVSSR